MRQSGKKIERGEYVIRGKVTKSSRVREKKKGRERVPCLFP